MTAEPKHYGPRIDPVMALTKAEHDLIVEVLGRPVTQDQEHRLRGDTVTGRTRAVDPNSTYQEEQ